MLTNRSLFFFVFSSIDVGYTDVGMGIGGIRKKTKVSYYVLIVCQRGSIKRKRQTKNLLPFF